jgi:nucleotide-binding universal stress UspA family protein
MTTVVLATDGSEYARGAAESAVEYAAERGATLHVLHAIDRRKFDEPAISSNELATIEAEDRGRDAIDEVANLAAGTGVSVLGDTRHGIPHEEIVRYADDVDADAIVVGRHGDHREHIGGVARKVRELASCDVLTPGLEV